MKDLNNEVVVATFHALANLVPLLGAEAVTGHSHRRIFSDGTPKVLTFWRLINDPIIKFKNF